MKRSFHNLFGSKKTKGQKTGGRADGVPDYIVGGRGNDTILDNGWWYWDPF